MDSRKVFCFLMQILRENHTAIQLILVTEAFYQLSIVCSEFP